MILKKPIKLLIFNNYFFVLIMLIPFIQPEFFSNNYITNSIYSYSRILFSVILFLFYISRLRYSKFVLVLTIFFAWKAAITYVNTPTFFGSYLLSILPIIAFVLLLEMVIQNNPAILLKALSHILGFFILINLVLMLLYPQGLFIESLRAGEFRSAHFLGIENALAYIEIPSLVIFSIYSWYCKKRFDKFVIIQIIAVLVTFFITKSGTAIVTLLTLLACLSLIFNRKIISSVNFKKLMLIYTLLFFLIVVAQSFDFFSSFIRIVLQKDMTLSARTILWHSSFDLIKNSFWTGYGSIPQGGFIIYRSQAYSSHNVILQNMLESGIIGVIILIFLIVMSGRRLDKFNDSILSKILSFGILCVLVSYLTEAYIINYLLLLLVLAFNIKEIINFNNIYFESKDNSRAYSKTDLI